MLLEMIRFVRGYAVFEIKGRFPERFLNITARNGVRLWSARRRGDDMTAAMYLSDYRRIRMLARAAGVHLRVCERRGLPTYARRWRGRLGVAVGAFVFILTVFVMSRFVWSIEITGLDTISESLLREQLSAHGLSVGAWAPSLDGPAISRAVMLDNSRIGWMAVNLTGSHASVEIKEEASAPQIPDSRQPMNVKARRDGTILRIEAEEGTIVCKEGSGAAKGQLIVSGVMENRDGGARLVRAHAAVIAATAYGADFSIPAEAELTFPDGCAGERRSLHLFGLRIPLSGCASDSELTAYSDRLDCLTVLDVVLPVGVIRERITGWKRQTISLNEKAAKQLLMQKAQLYELFALSRCTVTDRHYCFSRDGGVYTLSVRYDCEEDIAVQTPIGIE